MEEDLAGVLMDFQVAGQLSLANSNDPIILGHPDFEGNSSPTRVRAVLKKVTCKPISCRGAWKIPSKHKGLQRLARIRWGGGGATPNKD